MSSETVTCTSLDDLRRIVREALCAKENLLVDQFPLVERVVKRGGTVCGLQFTLHGPRNVRLGAVWTADRNQILLYDAQGERYGKLYPDRFLSLDELETEADQNAA